MSTEYVLDTASDLGRDQVDYLQVLFDQPTRRFLDALGTGPGARCLEVGAGGGSIASWLADRVGPGGSVVAVDTKTHQLAARPNLRVLRHDINDGVPPGGPYDLIHARLVLMHLPRRVEILDCLVKALGPGGWLVLGESTEYGTRPQDVLAARNPDDIALFNRVVDTTFQAVGRAAGIHYEWKDEVAERFAAAGLTEIHASEYAVSASGGTAGALLTANYVRQVRSHVLDAGITEDELTRFDELSRDPGFSAWCLPLIQYAGRAAAD